MRKRFESTGIVVDLPRSGRLKTVSTEENLTEVAQTFDKNPNQSAVKVSKCQNNLIFLLIFLEPRYVVS